MNPSSEPFTLMERQRNQRRWAAKPAHQARGWGSCTAYSFSPKFKITQSVLKNLMGIERARGFLEAAKLSKQWIRKISRNAFLRKRFIYPIRKVLFWDESGHEPQLRAVHADGATAKSAKMGGEARPSGSGWGSCTAYLSSGDLPHNTHRGYTDEF